MNNSLVCVEGFFAVSEAHIFVKHIAHSNVTAVARYFEIA